MARLKGPTRPVQPANSRASVLGAIDCVDLVVVFDQDTPFDLIGALVPDVLIKGADYTEEQIVGRTSCGPPAAKSSESSLSKASRPRT